MPYPEGSTLHISRPLTDVSVAYMQGPSVYVADRVFPIVPVSHQTDLYNKYVKGDWFRAQAALRAPATESAGGGWDITRDSYIANVWAVHKDLDEQTLANADAEWPLDRDATQWVTQNLLIKRDLEFCNTYLKTGVWGLDITGVAAAPGVNQVLRWDVAGSDPIGDIQRQSIRILEQTGYRPNKLVIGPWVELALLNHASILARINGGSTNGNPAIANRQLLAQLFGVNEILVTEAVQNTGPNGGTDSFAFQHGKGALLVYSAPQPSTLMPSGGYIFSWTGLLGAGATGIAMRKFYLPAIASNRIEGQMAFAMKLTCNDVGTFFATIVT